MCKIRLTLFFIVLNISFLFSQNPEISCVRFEYDNGIKANSFIGISFYTMDAYSKTTIVEIEVKKVKSKIEIPIEKYKEITSDFFMLTPKDIIKIDSLFVMDAAEISLSYTNHEDSITYSAYALNRSDLTSTRQNFLALIRKILKIANVKISEID